MTLALALALALALVFAQGQEVGPTAAIGTLLRRGGRCCIIGY
jgi:hypothetical protein